ncbi:MAG: endonuclease/exonuclease/phosphatase family protein [Desulfobacteraceae bacterium]|jgi:endonuclease/exonuclease/phosphatase family metal-dependent hydrolase
MINCFVAVFFLILCFVAPLNVTWAAQSFRVANYNVENLFDVEKSGAEYDEYNPFGSFGWDKAMVDIKCSQLARVIVDLRADIIGLEEVESKKALFLLQAKLKSKGADYPFSAMVDTGRHAIGCALLSKRPMKIKKDLPVDKGRERNILKVIVDIDGKPFVIYVNHWASKKNPESDRIKSARVLINDLESLPSGTDFLVIGDFNSDYDEFINFAREPELNDTQGRTGINHVLRTIHDGIPVDKKRLRSIRSAALLYNLWLELPFDQRWSYIFKGRGSSLDHMIIPASLYDGRGIDYKDNSFNRFAPDYLFIRKSIFRWQMGNAGKGRHLGKGYSDHLPVYADFTINK